MSETDEELSYAVVPEGDGGTVTVTVSTTDDEGIHGHDSEEVEVEVPPRGVLFVEIESDNVGLVPNQTNIDDFRGARTR
jgi:hypothetical protein